MERKNFFELLDLLPPREDRSFLERTLEEHRERWARDRTEGPAVASRLAQRNLELLPEMRRVLLDDPGLRQQEARRAQEIYRRRREEAERRLEAAIGEMQAVGVCPPDRLERLVEDHGRFFSHQEIEDRLGKAGIALTNGPSGSDPAFAAILTQRLEDDLGLLGYRDLYQFLGVDPKAPLEQLQIAAVRRSHEARRTGLTDTATEARLRLASQCQVLFRTEEGQAQYDRWRARKGIPRTEGYGLPKFRPVPPPPPPPPPEPTVPPWRRWVAAGLLLAVLGVGTYRLLEWLAGRRPPPGPYVELKPVPWPGPGDLCGGPPCRLDLRNVTVPQPPPGPGPGPGPGPSPDSGPGPGPGIVIAKCPDPPPAFPTVAVVVSGAEGLTGVIRRNLEQSLRGVGLEVVSSAAVADLSEPWFPRRAGSLLAEPGLAQVDVVVLVHLEISSTTDLELYGRHEVQKQGSLEVRAFRVCDDRGLGDWSSPIEFSDRDARERARVVSAILAPTVADELATQW